KFKGMSDALSGLASAFGKLPTGTDKAAVFLATVNSIIKQLSDTPSLDSSLNKTFSALSALIRSYLDLNKLVPQSGKEDNSSLSTFVTNFTKVVNDLAR